MNDIRKNTKEEVVIVKAQFKIPKFFWILTIIFLFFAALFLTRPFVFLFLDDSAVYDSGLETLHIMVGSLSLIAGVFFAIATGGVKKSSCEITNKRIKGSVRVFGFKKTFSYRIDEINNIEIGSFLGLHTLILNFSQGYGPTTPVRYGRGGATINAANTFRITFLSNEQEMYDELSDLLTSVKNDKDLQTDIEMSKIAVEEKKANAFETMAQNLNGTMKTSSYIEELKELKNLLDSEVITKEEFENKKKELLK